MFIMFLFTSESLAVKSFHMRKLWRSIRDTTEFISIFKNV